MRFLIDLLPHIRKFILGLVIFSAMLVATYWLLFDQIGHLHQLADDEPAFIIGQVISTKTLDGRQNLAAYALSDVTGTVWCLSRHGAPRRQAVVIVWGEKTTTHRGRTICREQGRMGSF